MLNVHALRGAAGILAFFLFWQVGVSAHLPIIAKIPGPIEVGQALWKLLHDPKYYLDWLVSFERVLLGFCIAQAIGIPLGLFMGWKQNFYYLSFPVFEVLRPIPPLAWVPLSIVFWPTAESSITFVIFLGAFFTVLINTVGGVKAIDERYVRAAMSLGASPQTIFRKIILPGALPSIFMGMSVGMGITWSVLVAAEIIAGKNGLGYLTWEAYVAGSFPIIIVGMISIGVAGYLSSVVVRQIGARAMPWTNRF
ncbi:MAG: ABC transporter permease [Candidatus Eremiobacteraeota bacterium]|nr:ABC transporter permease [Candidatus Eremiobacteraeota bacterium]